MADRLTPARRSANMRAIRSRDTGPELAIRRLLREHGLTGYRLHRRELPGRPDVAFVGRRKAIFVHGCFWHGHDCREGTRRPRSRQDYWLPKIERNQQRDRAHVEALVARGWTVFVIWDCEVPSFDARRRLLDFVDSPGDPGRFSRA